MLNGEGLDDERHVSLSDGRRMPMVALGTWQVPDGDECAEAVRQAIEYGYRHVDTAQAYGNERSIGEGLRRSGVARDEIFVTTKFYPGKSDPVSALGESLDCLGLDYVDLYLVHWPQGGPLWAWSAMERERDIERALSIGVSNFDSKDLESLMKVARLPPVVNQVQFSPFEYRRRLVDVSKESGVAVEAYSPLGTGQHLSNQTVRRIAERTGRSPAQVLLRWCVQQGIALVTKSTKASRIKENLAIFDFSLTKTAMEELASLDRTDGTDRAREITWWR
jgi:diketogulonate reductase-like aldo/keto reductase